MYRVSAKQIVVLALSTALLTAAIIVCAQRAFERRGTAIEPVAIADPSVATDEQNNIDIYRAVSPGVVNITSQVYQNSLWGAYPTQGSGSGSIIDPEGHILTNYHVIQGATELKVQIENDNYTAHVIGTDRDNDLAIVQVEAPRNRLTVVKLGTSQGLQVGQKVLAIGNPFGLQRTLTTGIISGLERPLHDQAARRTIPGAIQTDASINPGNSGGPLLNSRGEVIGINTAIFSTNGREGGAGSIGIGFAIPVDTAKKIVPTLISRGYVARPWLGASTYPLSTNIIRAFRLPVQEGGIIVGDVYRGTGAAAAGLRGAVIGQSLWGGATLEQIGDVILTIDGQKVTNTDDLQGALEGKRPGQTVQVLLLRNGNRLTVPLRLSERPQQEG
ncbi:MAG TPA: trypsin-like peptidase domain-containing protein [Blastocatellia bacterium]|nr:trypsin-like peptidase domain-containing protein [Blastocatellia bacterium]